MNALAKLCANSLCSSMSLEADKDFLKFQPSKDGVDQLYHNRLNESSKYSDLWKVMQQLLLISHGQATVERGFSVNKQTSDYNLKKEGLVARRRVIQAVRKAGGPTNVAITKELLSYASSSRAKYEQHLESKRKEKEAENRAQKRKAQGKEVEDMKIKRSRLQADIQALKKSADQKALDAEKYGRLPLLAESNALGKGAVEKEEELQEMTKLIEEKIQSVEGGNVSMNNQ